MDYQNVAATTPLGYTLVLDIECWVNSKTLQTLFSLQPHVNVQIEETNVTLTHPKRKKAVNLGKKTNKRPARVAWMRLLGGV